MCLYAHTYRSMCWGTGFQSLYTPFEVHGSFETPNLVEPVLIRWAVKMRCEALYIGCIGCYMILCSVGVLRIPSAAL